MTASSSGSPRTACCVTGQMRSYHLSRLNWKAGPTVSRLLGAGYKVDWFLVTSNTSSYRWYVENVAPEDGGFVDTHVAPGCSHFNRYDNESWKWRDLGDDGLEFNIARFPSIHGQLHGTLMVQHWQLGKCREMLMQRERNMGFKYRRVVRLRTDTVFGARSELRTWRRTPPDLDAITKPWIGIHDWVLAGSRELMVDIFLNGLEHLPKVRKLTGLQRVWHELYRVALQQYQQGAQYISWDDGDVDGSQVDLTRSVGPPRKRFFLQVEEPEHAQHCFEQQIAPIECWRMFKQQWHLDVMQQNGAGFVYDWPPRSCADPRGNRSWSSANPRQCIADAHVEAFGASNIVGDPTHWHIFGANVTGYSWASIKRKRCDSNDGWIT